MLRPAALAVAALAFAAPDLGIPALESLYDYAESTMGGIALGLAATLAGVDLVAGYMFPGPRRY